MGLVTKSIRELQPEGDALDFSDFIMHECICGSNLWRVLVWFGDYEIAGWFTEMECAMCGTQAKTPTPIDRPE